MGSLLGPQVVSVWHETDQGAAMMIGGHFEIPRAQAVSQAERGDGALRVIDKAGGCASRVQHADRIARSGAGESVGRGNLSEPLGRGATRVDSDDSVCALRDVGGLLRVTRRRRAAADHSIILPSRQDQSIPGTDQVRTVRPGGTS
jgi:hypothetical protein